MSGQPITTPMLIPRKILSDGEQKIFDQFEKNPAELEKRFKWWSMHDLMKHFHSGLMTIENDANMFSFVIDLTAPELAANSLRNPQLLSSLNTAMANLSKVTNEISGDFTQLKEANAAQSTKMVLNATSRGPVQTGGGRKKYKGGDVNISEKYSATRLKMECLNDLALDPFGSRDRIFIVDGILPVAPDALKNQISVPVEAATAAATAATAAASPPAAAGPAAVGPVAAAAAVPPAAIGLKGGRRRTRRARKSGKKAKTHRKQYRRRY